MDNFGGSKQFASWIHVRASDLVYRTGETIYSAEHLHETQNKITRKQTEFHATWIEFSFEMRGTTKFGQRYSQSVPTYAVLTHTSSRVQGHLES